MESVSNVQKIRIIKILHGALTAGALLFTLVVLFVSLHNESQVKIMPLLYKIMYYAAGFIVFMTALALFQKKVKPLQTFDLDLSAKLDAYRSATLLQAGILEAFALVSTVAYMLTGFNVCMIGAAAMIALMIYLWPSDKKMAGDMAEPLDNLR